MTSLLDMNSRMEQWQAEKPGFDNIELRLFENDIALVQFVASGSDGDAFIKVYKSHIFPGVNAKSGKRFNNYRYCTQHNDGTECVFCAQGHTEIKERMSMWFYTYMILHAGPVQRLPNLPQTTYLNRVYYQEDVQGFKRWDESAWAQSPWASIIQLYTMYGSLHNFVGQLGCTGREVTKRFSIVPLPNSAFLPPELYQRAIQECMPIPQMLRAQQQQPVQANPTAGATALQPNGMPAAPVMPFQVPGTPNPPPLVLPTGMPAAIGQVVAPVPDFGIPGAPPVYAAAPPPAPLPIPAAVPAPAPVYAPPPPAAPVAPVAVAVPVPVAVPVAPPPAPPVQAQAPAPQPQVMPAQQAPVEEPARPQRMF
jgi:hypothetical protein